MSSDDLTGHTIAGYHLEQRIGEGGTAVVYRARHPDHEVCALKVLRGKLKSDPAAVKRFLREAEYGSRVRHECVVRTYAYGEADGEHYLAMEWAAGEPLSVVIERSGPLTPAATAAVVEQLAAALTASHAAGIVHRDLKPENVMYTGTSGASKLLDFGIARDADDAVEERLTRAGYFVGSLEYVAPEALSGELVDARADIYSLATIAYYLLSGSRPFAARTPHELFRRVLTEPPMPLNRALLGRSVSPALERAVMQGLSRDPSARQPTVGGLAEAVRAGVEAEPPAPQQGGWLTTWNRLVGRRP
jgi:serine/threonine protein kinase